MLWRALLLSAVLAGLLGCADALAARTVVRVGGEVKAVAFAGDALVVARQRTDGSLRVERRAPGTAVQTLLALPRRRSGYVVSLAGSAQAIAIGVRTRERNDRTRSRVFGGPSAGPLRLLASCDSVFAVSPVAVSGSRLAWPEGACGLPAKGPRLVSPLMLALGDADGGVAVRRVPVGSDVVPIAIVLSGDSGLVGSLRLSLSLIFDGEVRSFSMGALGEPVTAEKDGAVAPLGALSNGDNVYVSGGISGDDSSNAPGDCASRLFVLTPGSSQRRELSLGGCLVDQPLPPVGSTRVTGDRVYALVRRQGSVEGDGLPVALRSFRGDGGTVRLWARGRYRRPLGVATSDSGAVVWWQRGCSGGSEIVTDDGGPPVSSFAIVSCSVKVLTRSARVRDGQITVRLRCRTGCSGAAGVDPKYRRTHLYSFQPGTHRLRLRLTRQQRGAPRVRLRVVVEAGAFRSAVIRLR